MTDDCKVCNAIYDVREGGEPTGYCDPCAQSRVAELEEREPLVQEVIAKWNAYAAAQSGDAVGISHLRADALLAARKLAEWKP